jgi:purine nucleosidase
MDLTARTALAAAASASPDLHLVCLGPLTNLAAAVAAAPDLVAQLDTLTIMGGLLRPEATQPPTSADFNFQADPEAAQAVLRAGFKRLQLVPLDVCQQVRLTPAQRDRVAALGTPASRAFLEVLAPWSARVEGGLGLPLYDPLAWLAATHPDLLTWRDLSVSVDTAPADTRGATLVDWTGISPDARGAVGVRDLPAVFDVLCAALAA